MVAGHFLIAFDKLRVEGVCTLDQVIPILHLWLLEAVAHFLVTLNLVLHVRRLGPIVLPEGRLELIPVLHANAHGVEATAISTNIDISSRTVRVIVDSLGVHSGSYPGVMPFGRKCPLVRPLHWLVHFCETSIISHDVGVSTITPILVVNNVAHSFVIVLGQVVFVLGVEGIPRLIDSIGL